CARIYDGLGDYW
nr:immunoglobulin heavy chain junction region [Macaca mulatta]MOY22118.1 immunoglobulin heavy chain junction region [Macaca mulatta]MOY22549.1 immunoglobulin heavy chain junction region [Macaca mulatta]MOY23035.1 immunoglobulin heavy chain junction region [Macaca mulatta]MOY23421.1 immunoglobulin heavy chain junction region [Macaca mulatta]